MYSALKRLVVGRPIATSEGEERRLPKTVALPTFSSDAISSTAYATEEILFVLALSAGSSLALGLSRLVPISIVVAVLIAIVVASYRQTIFAYPNGGGSYLVSRDNLGKYPSLVAGASLLIDYILTVAVSISAGVAAIISLPAFRGWADHRVGIGLILILIITLANLRGLKESGSLFAFPTYTYILSISALVGYGLLREFFGAGVENIPPPDREHFEGALAGGSLPLLLLLRGFSSGAVALTGIEAIADGVPNFRKPEAKNAATTLTIMGVILASLFVGVSVLAHHLGPYPTHDETVISQMGRAVYGGGPLYVILQFATAAILTLAANTAYADFPRLSSIIARDSYLPRQFMNQGDRLVFSNGVVFLAVAAGGLLIAFGGITTALIPLYAVGVFTSFTLSQSGMVKRHLNLREPGWRKNIVVNAVGATATFTVLLIVAVSKFAVGAWLPIVVIPLVIALFTAIRRHYDRVAEALTIEPAEARPIALNHTVVVLVGRVHKGVLKALAYAQSLRPQQLVALYVSYDEEDQARMERQWREFGIDVPLTIQYSKYRDLVEPVMEYINQLDMKWDNDTVTVVIPEFVVGKWYEQVLHNQSALFLKGKLLFRENTVVTSVPYHLESQEEHTNDAAQAEPEAEPEAEPAEPEATKR
ncbi:MAG: APC family permease [Actinomycetota bacterium]|nr:APC family permease [Actinomycetota bacterium]